MKVAPRFLRTNFISYLKYDRVYDDGTGLSLSSCRELQEFTSKTSLPVTPSIPDELVSKCFIYLLPAQDPVVTSQFEELKARFGIGSLAYIVERQGSYYDQICLMSPKGQDWAANRLVNQSSAYFRFFSEFRDEILPVLQEGLEKRTQLHPGVLPKINWSEVKTGNSGRIRLSKREQECLSKVALGLTIREIAISLGLSPRTVEHYIENMRNKIGCSKKTEIISRGIELGLLDQQRVSPGSMDLHDFR